ncbi:C-type lectin domain family 2 member B-like isoform X1 [Dendropsophus ebraccatus]|uniref:C-type lectin domain family 2 member B-like isoform X1 n=1 Tax=Dendropsophus ebraccatus TaxID=150705 RepID=UPI003831A3DC
MGVFEEDPSLRDPVFTTEKTGNAKDKQKGLFHPLRNYKAGNAKDKQKGLFHPLRNYKAVRLVIGVLILVIIGLIAVLIIVSTARLMSCNEINMETEKSTSGSQQGKVTNVTDTINQRSAPCEDDWIWYRGKCYYFSTEHKNWSDSERFCRSHDASLAIIDNKVEYDFMFRFKGSESHWIGLRRTDNNTAWIWTDGTLYDGSLFPIQRSLQDIIEYVYLNSKEVRSQGGSTELNWICHKTNR